MRLTETPRFQKNCWLTKALVTGSWADLPPDALGSEYSHFLAALKELDQTGVPPPNPLDLDGSDFRVALGLDPLNGAIPSNYNTGRAQAWACLLHFQVLDLILATDFPHLSEASLLTPLAPGFVNDKAARKVLNPLKTWQRQFKAFEEAVEKMPGEVALPSSGVELREQGAPATPQAESLLPLMAYTKIRNISAKFLAFKNLQAAATALVWILELGSSVAPLRTEGGLLNIAPLSPVYTRYQSAGGTERMDRDPKLTPSQFLRPLSLALRISPVILCCSSDLSANHLDLEVEEEISHLLLAVNPRPPGLLFYEQCVYSLVRGSSGSHSAQQSITREHLNTLLCGRPDATIQDEQIFRDVITRYDAAAALAATDSTRPHSITAPLTPVTSVWSARVAAIPVHAGGHISRALSQMPSHRPPRSSSPVQMNLITDLTRSDILFMQPPTPISEESGANVHNDRSDDRSGEVSEITQDQPTGSYIISTAENLQEENIAAPTEITPNGGDMMEDVSLLRFTICWLILFMFYVLQQLPKRLKVQVDPDLIIQAITYDRDDHLQTVCRDHLPQIVLDGAPDPAPDDAAQPPRPSGFLYRDRVCIENIKCREEE
ncbi:hypothetical protein B0H16DRAFT_1816509 [Mycena metata]|uniref:Uncharacterized protein n=1 Tax=Mycena metata TaxID=1033252 RepID=A0AAD7MD38_9AGAR|nr:hypothetical protein B0H16DRAFT_1816509 [Mycena metata]